jgi:hypothetical protein
MRLTDHTLVKRVAQPEDVAVVLQLSSTGAFFMTDEINGEAFLER